MPHIKDVTDGTLLAKSVALSRFRGDQAEALRRINTASPTELGIAVNYLAGRLREALLEITDGEENQALRMLVGTNVHDRVEAT